MSLAIAAAPGLEAVCDRLLAEAMRVIPVTKASIMKYDPADGTLRIVAARGIPGKIVKDARVKVGEGISGRVFASSLPLLVKDVRSVAGVRPRARYRGRSLIAAPVTCMPMKVGGTPVGVINMTDRRDGVPFTERDLELLTTIANQVAAYLHLCDLAAEVESARRTERELETARQIQHQLFPSSQLRLHGLDVAGTCLTSARVGGDYYDFFPAHDGPVSAVIADVAGHNVAAALTMASLRSVLRAEAATPAASCGVVVERINRILSDDLIRAEQFISLVYLQYLHDAMTFRFCIAGHPAPLLYCAERKAIVPLVGSDGLIGIDAAGRFNEHHVRVHRGDVLILYTDGLPAAGNARGKAFGLARFKQAIMRSTGRTAKAIVAEVVRAIRTHVGSTTLADDVTLAVLKVR